MAGGAPVGRRLSLWTRSTLSRGHSWQSDRRGAYQDQTRIGLRLLKQESVNWLCQALGLGELSRNGLARGLGLADGWLNPNHEPCVASAAGALPQPP